MESISAFSGNNIAGFEILFFLPKNYINSLPEAQNGKIDSAPVLNTVSDFFSIEALKGSVNFTELTKESTGGILFDQEVSCFIPKLTLNQLANVKSMEGYQYVLKLKDNNGYYRIIGSVESPLMFSYTPDTRQQPGELNGITLKWKGQSNYSAPYYTV